MKMSSFELCPPAKLYLVISVISLFFMSTQNIGSGSTYCVGNYGCDMPNKGVVFIIKVLYIVFWTWLLNLICKAGAPMVSWVMVLFPFILMFILIATFMLANGRAGSVPY